VFNLSDLKEEKRGFNHAIYDLGTFSSFFGMKDGGRCIKGEGYFLLL
jgi:hypothetical protein